MESPQKVTKIEISTRTILFAVFIFLLLKFLWIVQDLLFSLFIAFMIMSITKPLVFRLEKIKIPRTISALVIFFLLFFLIGQGVSLLLPTLISDMTALFRNLSILIENLDPSITKHLNGKALSDYLPNVTNQVLPVIRYLFSNVIFLITTLFFSFYFIIEEDFIKNFLKKFFKDKDAERAARVFDKAEKRMSSWFYGEIVLMVIIGVLTYIGLSLIGVRHALSLAVIAGLLEAFPVIGPVVSAIPALIFALNQGGVFLGLSTAALYLIIQQLENNLIVPAVMKKAVGLNKILILLVLIIGGKLAGILGLFLAIPITLFIESILAEVTNKG